MTPPELPHQAVGPLSSPWPMLCPSAIAHWLLGKNGVTLHEFANGRDSSTVHPYYYIPPVKTIGNSVTTPRDLTSEDDVKITLLALCESVAARLREQQTICTTVQLGVRDNTLVSYERQAKLKLPTSNASDLQAAALQLFLRHHTTGRPVRSLSVRALGLVPSNQQLSLFEDEQVRQKEHDLEAVIDRIRGKYGYSSIRRGVTLLAPELDLDAKGENTVHPVGFLSSR